jgi:hypothetical protein
MDLAGI